MTNNDFNNKLFSFIEHSCSPFHAVSSMETNLIQNGFTKLHEDLRWSTEPGGRYFVLRNGALAAFTLGRKTTLSSGFRIIGAHTDSPCFQIKPNPRKKTEPYVMLGIEKYGGPILSTWLDRELSLAGRVIIDCGENNLKSILIDFKKPLVYIPNLAIHLNRDVNDGISLNVQNDLSPVFAQAIDKQIPDLYSIIRNHIVKECWIQKVCSVTAFDLFCYDLNKPSYFGLNQEFIAAPRLDNLLSCFIGLETILQTGDETNTFLICNNHEEIGSTSESGAHGSFAANTISRLFEDNQDMLINLNKSILLSLDNAHAEHPYHRDKSDPDHRVLLNKGRLLSSTLISATLLPPLRWHLFAILPLRQEFPVRISS